MENIFNAYSLHEQAKVDIIVKSKAVNIINSKKNTYYLKGISPNGYEVVTLVNKSQWDKFDVPIETKYVKKVNRKSNRIKDIQDKRKKKITKSNQKVYNEEIQKWIAEHYGLDLNNLPEN